MAIADWNTLRKAATQAGRDGVICLATIETVERANSRAVVAAVNDAAADLAARLYRDGALARLHLFVCRAFAKVSHDDDWHLRAAIDFLRDRIDEEPALGKREALSGAVAYFDVCAYRPELARLNHYRNKVLAHLGAYHEAVPQPTYRDLFTMARATAAICRHLAAGAIAFHEMDKQIAHYQGAAGAFWSVWGSDDSPQQREADADLEMHEEISAAADKAEDLPAGGVDARVVADRLAARYPHRSVRDIQERVRNHFASRGIALS